jgi:hypothetical protein
MKMLNWKILVCFGLAILLSTGGAGLSYAQLGSLSSIAGGGGGAAPDVNALADKQSALAKRLQSALIETLGAQVCFAKALGNKEQADKLQVAKDALAKGNTDDETYAKYCALTSDTDKEIAKKLSEMKQLDATQKQEIQNGLVPYAKGTAQTVLLGKDFATHLKDTQAAVSKASVANIAQIKSKLGLTLSVAPKMPELGSSHVNTATTLIKIAKSNNLKTEEPEKIVGSLSL